MDAMKCYGGVRMVKGTSGNPDHHVDCLNQKPGHYLTNYWVDFDEI